MELVTQTGSQPRGRPASACRITLVGEAMLELSGSPGGGWRLGYGGDTLNTAIHLARLGHRPSYLSAIGTDRLSEDLRASLKREGLDCALLLSDPSRGTGLYAIAVDEAGEREFRYWREESAARLLFAHPVIDEAVSQAASSDLLAFSLISLAILPAEGREALIDLANRVRKGGGTVAFDGNFRPSLWASREDARAWRDRAIAVADIGLPTFEDEALLSGSATPDAVAKHWQHLGCSETLVKLGASGVRAPDGEIIPPAQVRSPVDTSGAGDAFNAGYLAARIAGAPVEDAIASGQELAGWSVMGWGAVPAVDQDAPYAKQQAGSPIRNRERP